MTDPAPDVPGLAEWVTLSESLLRGLLHALNNRVTALGAFAELAALGDEEITAERVLPGELARLQQLNLLFRLLVLEVSAAEALELNPVLDDVLALHGHHPALRALRCEIVRLAPLPALRVPRWALLRLLLLVVEGVKQHAERSNAHPAQLRITCTDAVLSIRGDALGPPPRYAQEMAQRCGGTLTQPGGEWLLELPTLFEVRRRERSAREAQG